MVADRKLNETRCCFEQCRDDAKVVDLHWHNLRHTFASRLVSAGAIAESQQVSWALVDSNDNALFACDTLKWDQAVEALMNFYTKPVEIAIVTRREEIECEPVGLPTQEGVVRVNQAEVKFNYNHAKVARTA
jgi:hypothetical protein